MTGYTYEVRAQDCSWRNYNNAHNCDIWPVRWKKLDVSCLWTIFCSLLPFLMMWLLEKELLWYFPSKCKGMSFHFGCKALNSKRVTYKLNQGRLNYSGMELQEIYVHSNMHWPPVERKFMDEHGNVMKLGITECCIMHMEYVPKRGRVANSYLMNQRLSNGPKSCFSLAWPYHSEWLDSVFILWAKISHKYFFLHLVRNLIDEAENWGALIHLPEYDQDLWQRKKIALHGQIKIAFL